MGQSFEHVNAFSELRGDDDELKVDGPELGKDGPELETDNAELGKDGVVPEKMQEEMTET